MEVAIAARSATTLITSPRKLYQKHTLDVCRAIAPTGIPLSLIPPQLRESFSAAAASLRDQDAAQIETQVFKNTFSKPSNHAQVERAEVRGLIDVWETLRHEADTKCPMGDAGALINQATNAGLVELLAPKPGQSKASPSPKRQHLLRFAAPPNMPLASLRVSRQLEACDIVMIELVRQCWPICAERGALLESVRGVISNCLSWLHTAVTRLADELRGLPSLHQRHEAELRAVQAELQAERSETSRLRDLVMQLENRQKALEERLGKTTALLDSTQTDALAANAKLYQAEKMRLGYGMVSSAVQTERQEAIAGATAWAFLIDREASEQLALFSRLGAVGRAECLSSGAPSATVALLLTRLTPQEAAETLALATPDSACAAFAAMRSAAAAAAIVELSPRASQRIAMHVLERATLQEDTGEILMPVTATWLFRACAELLQRRSDDGCGARAMAHMLEAPNLQAATAASALVRTLDYLENLELVVPMLRDVFDALSEPDAVRLLPHLPLALARFVLTLEAIPADTPAGAPPSPPTLRTLAIASRLIDCDDEGKYAARLFASYISPAGGARTPEEPVEATAAATAAAGVAFRVVLGLSAQRQAQLLVALHAETRGSFDMTKACEAFTRACLGATAVGDWQSSPTATRTAAAELLFCLLERFDDKSLARLLTRSLSANEMADALEAAYPTTAARALEIVCSQGKASEETKGPPAEGEKGFFQRSTATVSPSESKVADALSKMLPETAVACLAAMDETLVASLMSRIPYFQKQEITARLPDNPLAAIKFARGSPQQAAATLMAEACLLLSRS